MTIHVILTNVRKLVLEVVVEHYCQYGGSNNFIKELTLLSLTLQDHFKYSAYVRGEEMLVYHKISKEGRIYLNGSR